MPVQRPCPPPGTRPEPLKDPCGDRPVTSVDAPPAQLLTADVYYRENGEVDIELLKHHLKREGLLGQELLLDIIRKASDLFEQEPNLLKLVDPITVVGDIHGQYYDLQKLLEIGGEVKETQYLFLGDYVDRGSFSIECVVLLYSLKIKYPKNMRMIRGNHECRQMTSYFNFREECEYKYNLSVYDAVMDSFDLLPLGALINGKFLAVHGGLSPELTSVKMINSINRFQEPPSKGLLCDILWSDPLDKDDDKSSKKKGDKGTLFINNATRGCSYHFSFESATRFLKQSSLLSIIRAHEAQLEGYKMHTLNPVTNFPAVITIFSAPNYCDVYNNKGALLKFVENTLNILQFNCSPHPYHLPNFMDVFAWSMPFVIEKVTEMLFRVLQPEEGAQEIGDDDLPPLPPKILDLLQAAHSDKPEKVAAAMDALENAGDDTEKAESRTRIRKKVRTVGRMVRMFKTLREENELVLRLKGVCPGHKLQPGLLLDGKERLASELEAFGLAVDLDAVNEVRPDLPVPETPGGSKRTSITNGDSDDEAVPEAMPDINIQVQTSDV